MITDATYTVDLTYDGVKSLNDSERIKLRRRHVALSDVNVVIINFDDLHLSKVAAVSKFAAMVALTDDWKVVAPLLPLRIKRAAGDSCILSAIDPPRRVRLVIERAAVDVAMHNVVKEMKKFDLSLRRSSITSI